MGLNPNSFFHAVRTTMMQTRQRAIPFVTMAFRYLAKNLSDRFHKPEIKAGFLVQQEFLLLPVKYDW